MLERGPYPEFLKSWIKSNKGHLSNLQSSISVLEHANKKLKHVILAHLSMVNNSEKIAYETFNHLLKQRKDLKVKINLSRRHKATPLFKI